VHLGRRRKGFSLGDPNRSGSNALTASGFKVTRKDADLMRRLIQPWQSRAFSYYDLLGEIKYASQFYARMLSPLILYAAEKDAKGDIVPTKNVDAIEALERIQDPGGGRTSLLGAYGRLMFLTGEAYLFVSTDPETGIEQWEMLSTDELRIQSGVMIRYKAPSVVAEEYHEPDEPDSQEGAWVPVDPKTAVAYRLWQKHPRWSLLADSTMQGVLDLCEELLLLTQAVRARARSRLAGSGLLLIDERVSPPPLEAVPDEDPQEDPFIASLVNNMTLPIVNEGAASAIVPLVLRVPVPEGGKVADLISHLQIIDPTQLYPETGLRYECIKRIAIGLDMPPEILLGLQDSNHWTAWQIDEQTWKGHGAPKAVQLVDDLTASYFRPYLRDVVGLADWDNYYIAFDPTNIINHPDRTKDAKDLYDRRAISKEALRRENGFAEADAPTDDELNEMIGVAVHDGSLALFGEPSPRGGFVETAPGQVVSAPPPGLPGAPSQQDASQHGQVRGAEQEKGPSKSSSDETAESSVGSLSARVMGASDMAVLRAREAAGSRLRSLAKKDPTLLAKIDGVRNSEVAHALGKDGVRALRANEAQLVSCAHELIVDAIRMWNLPPSVGEILVANIEKHAATTLYDRQPQPFPVTFGNYIGGLLAAA
jgi:hypothetical protein